MGCTEAEWLGWLPKAVGDHPYQLHTGIASVRLGAGVLDLTWQGAASRVIGLISIPVLQVSFQFVGVDDTLRHTFMVRFDLHMQRGGG